MTLYKSMKSTREKIPYWDLGHMGDEKPSGYLIIENDGSHSHWSLCGEWKYNCGGPDCISKAKKHAEIHNLIVSHKPMKITNIVKKLIDKDTRTLIEAGFIDDGLSLTDSGASELMGILFLENKAELVKVARENLDDTN